MNDIREHVAAVWQDIRAAALRSGRDANGIRLVAATKFVPAERVREAITAGITICGENRLQEALAKMDEIGVRDDCTWHFIGRLQTRKIKAMVGRFALIHSLESVEQAEEMERRAKEAGIQQAALLEVNVANEESKGGFSPNDLIKAIPLLDRFLHLTIRGLMAIPPWTSNPEMSRPYFRQVRQLAEQVTHLKPIRIHMRELSMGMSQDFGVAIEEGATMVRIGTRIFGARKTKLHS